jgi:hypothetical protein
MSIIDSIFSKTGLQAGRKNDNATAQLKLLANRLPLIKSLRLTDIAMASGLYWIIDRRMKLDSTGHKPASGQSVKK